MDMESIEDAARCNAIFCTVNDEQFDEHVFAFMEGVEWRIDSVWHDAKKENPNGMSVILIDFGNDVGEEYGLGVSSEDLVGAKRWAYLADLLPGRKEEAK